MLVNKTLTYRFINNLTKNNTNDLPNTSIHEIQKTCVFNFLLTVHVDYLGKLKRKTPRHSVWMKTNEVKLTTEWNNNNVTNKEQPENIFKVQISQRWRSTNLNSLINVKDFDIEKLRHCNEQDLIILRPSILKAIPRST